MQGSRHGEADCNCIIFRLAAEGCAGDKFHQLPENSTRRDTAHFKEGMQSFIIPHSTLYFAIMMHRVRGTDLFSFARLPENITSLESGSPQQYLNAVINQVAPLPRLVNHRSGKIALNSRPNLRA